MAAVLNEKIGPPIASTDSDVGTMKVDESVRNEMAIISEPPAAPTEKHIEVNSR